MKLQAAVLAGFRHLIENRLRAGLSILGIFIGIASVLCMMTIGDGAKLLIEKDLEKLGGANQVHFRTRHSIWKRGRFVRRTTERYTYSDVRAIESECPAVRFVLPKNRGYQGTITALQGGQTRPYVEGVTADYATSMHWNVRYGRFFTREDIDTAAQVCVLGAEAAIDLFGNINAIGQEVKIKIRWRHPFVRCRVIGIMAPKGRSLRSYTSLDDIVCVPLTTHQQRLSGIRYIEYLLVFFHKGADVSGVIDSVRDVLQKRHRGTKDFISYRIPKRTLRRLEHIQKMIKIALGSIAGFSLFVSGIGIMNICLVSVGEKTREIGLRKSVGAKRIHIFGQFLTESICLCFCGGVLGIVGGWLAAQGMARLAVRILPIVDEWPVVLSVPWMLTSVVFSVFMGIIFGVYPAMRAARLTPIDALRFEN
ncbi:ABC transporter permease [Candidatus Poribacteria bacterium]|nr:ABC transporter permease [Candidatus Poribacteria bacterium]MYA56663.1 ABC transporter permease [Candidatus Poribacteria bacterium]